MSHETSRKVFVAPSYAAFGGDKIFDGSDPLLNRDDGMLPTIRLRQNLALQGVEIHTDDLMFDGRLKSGELADYYSFGMLRDYDSLRTKYDLNFRAFVIFEPPLVARKLYRALPELCRYFSEIYVHNTHGDGYSLEGVDRSKLRKLYWPQPYNEVVERYWSNVDRRHRLVVINGNHNPLLRLEIGSGELYSERIAAVAELFHHDAIDLYGRGWDQWWHPRSMWLPYWKHRRALMAVYKGSCVSKYEVMSRYQFCLCLENLAMDGYVTEKIFDCLYAGTIPVYLGARDIGQYIPAAAFVDARQFSSWTDMWRYVQSMPAARLAGMKEAGRDFFRNGSALRYYESLDRIFSVHRMDGGLS